MPQSRTHTQFDEYLAEKGVLLTDGKYKSVHKFMDEGVWSFGSEHRELDFYHGEDGLRQWLNGKWNVIGQDRATDWLRAGFGHLCLDDAERRLGKKVSNIKLFDSAYRSMCQRSWKRKYFRKR